jgi:hypothetical protein
MRSGPYGLHRGQAANRSIGELVQAAQKFLLVLMNQTPQTGQIAVGLLLFIARDNKIRHPQQGAFEFGIFKER